MRHRNYATYRSTCEIRFPFAAAERRRQQQAFFFLRTLSFVRRVPVQGRLPLQTFSRHFLHIQQTSARSMSACFEACEQDFSYTNSEFCALANHVSVRQRSLLSRRFDTDAQYDQMSVGKRRLYPGDNDPLHLDSKLRVTGKLAGSSCRVRHSTATHACWLSECLHLSINAAAMFSWICRDVLILLREQ